MFAQRGAGGWSSQDIATAHDSASGISVGEGSDYRFFSTDLSHALVEPKGEQFTPLRGEETAPFATERTVYLRSDFTCGSDRSTCYTSLVNSANTPDGTKISGSPLEVRGGAVRFLDATNDLSHVVLASNVALTAQPVTTEGIYEWANGGLQLVSVLPDGAPATENVALGYHSENTRNAVSQSGGKIAWSTDGGHLFVRDVENHTTVQMDAPEPGVIVSGAPGAQFQGASADMSRVFFTDSQKLTKTSGAREGEPELYEYNWATGSLIDITAGAKSAAVQGAVLGTSQDGSYVYFVANGALAPGASQGTCGGSATPGASCNLYVRHDSVTMFIAALANADAPDWNGKGTFATNGLQLLTARVSLDGRYLAFMSGRSLTGYDNRDAVSGASDEEAYLFDVESHRLVCASCNPTGARPVGEEYGGKTKLAGGVGVWQNSDWLATSIPGWTPYATSLSDHQSAYLSNSGRLFFNSHDALAPQDTNRNWDAYEFEPAGVGDCSTTNATYSESAQGCIGLISSGTSHEESAFLDASENGSDVFFLTTAKLSPQDLEGGLALYDAHECSSLSPCFTAPPAPGAPCTTASSCRPVVPTQPSGAVLPSITFSSQGNLLPPASPTRSQDKRASRAQKLAAALRACRKRRPGRRAACRTEAERRYGRKRQAKKQTAHRGLSARSAGARRTK